ncbi:hypothetical protein GCM10029964_020960 [Kibdelosporangium lantanae]
MAGTAPGGAARPSESPLNGKNGSSQESTAPDRQAQSRFSVPDTALLTLLGSRDENLKVVEELLAADVHVRGNEVTLSGTPADVAFAERVFAELVTLAGRGQQLEANAVRRTVAMLSTGTSESPAEVLSLDILSRRGRTIRPKTLNQKHYVDAIDKHTVVFGIGPAGTGKTYLAMAKAVQALQAKQVNRIILTRPAVEAGSGWGTCRARCTRRSTRTCVPCTTRCTTWSTPSPSRGSPRPARSRSPRWPTCVAVPNRFPPRC